MKKSLSILIIMFAMFGVRSVQASELTDLIVSKLGVSDTQASAGVGVILNYLESKVSSEDFNTVSEGVGGAGAYMKEAEEAGAYKETKVSRFSKTTELVSTEGLVGSTASSFSNLGLKTENISQYLDLIVSYLKDKGSTEAMNVLTNLSI